jgi:hypothetical protein
MSRQQNNDASEKPSYRGLCPYCKLVSGCKWPRNPKVPVYNCEEFEGENKIIENNNLINHSNPVNYHNSVVESPGTIKKYLGLCSNCELREECKFPKPESGVWRCEEYE